MGLKFNKLPTGDKNLDRVQEEIAKLARQIPAAAAPAIVNVTRDYTVKGNEDVVHVSAQAGPVRITLPAPSSTQKPLTVKQTDAQTSKSQVNTVTVATADGSKAIAGQASITLDNSGTGSVTITSDGTQYWPSGGSSSVTPGTKYQAGAGISIVGTTISSTAGPGLTPGQANTINTAVTYPFGIAEFYVAPWGDDGKNGLSWATAFQTIPAGLGALQAVGGGTLYVYDGSVGNIWLRGDALNIPGWFGDFPLRVIGVGTSHVAFGFPAAMIQCGSQTDQFHPGIWISGTFKPKEFISIGESNYINQFIRAWDYPRDTLGAIVISNISSWTRSGQSSTVTLSLPPAFNIHTFSRTGGSGLVTMTIDPSVRRNQYPVNVGQVIRVVSTDPNFNSGDFVVTELVSAGSVVRYTQSTTSGSGTITATNAGTVQFSGIGVNDYIQVTSTTQLNVPASAYLVTGLANGGSPNAAVVTVFDPYGGKDIGNLPDGGYSLGVCPTSGTFASPGTWVLQDRYSYNFSSIDWYNIQNQGRGAPTYDISNAGPNIDIGSPNDGRVRWYQCSPAGYVPGHGGCPDPDRAAWGLFSGGSQGALSFEAYDLRPQGTGARCRGTSNSGFVRVVNLLGDAPGNAAPPAVEVIDGSAAYCYFENVRTADTIGSAPDVKVDACIVGSTAVNCGRVQGPLIVSGNDTDGTRTAWTDGQSGFWPGSANSVRFAADMPHTRRSLPLSYSRVPNLAPATASWNLNGATWTTGIPDPFGGTRADQFVGGGGPYLLQTAPISVAAGDVFVVGGWFRKPGGFGASAINLSIVDNFSTIVASLYVIPFAGDGEWQFCANSVALPALAGSAWVINVAISPNAAGSPGVQVYLPFIEHLSSASFSANDMAEYAGTIANRTRYLTPGTVGTAERVPFIGHGGLGVDSTQLVTPTGATTQSGNLPLLAADGTVQAYIPTLPTNSTLRPYTMGARYVFADQAIVGSGVSPTVWLMAGGINQFNPDATRSEYPVPFAASRCLMYAIIDGGVLGHDITFQLTKNGSNVAGGTVVVPSGSVGPATPVTAVVVLAGASASDTYGLTESAAAGTGTWSGSVTLWFQ